MKIQPNGRSKVWWLAAMTMGAAPLSYAGQVIDKTLPASPSGYVEVEHQEGSATIQGWDRNEVKVEGELDDRAKDFIFERDDNEILIKVVMPKRNWRNRDDDDGDRLTIFVPRGSKLSYTAINADVEVEQIDGGSNLDTVNGDIDVKALQGRIRIESVNGGIDSEELNGDISFQTVNGDIEDNNSTGSEISFSSVNGDIETRTTNSELSAETVNGDMELHLAEVTSLDLDTVNGTLEAWMTLADDGEVSASSVGGKIELHMQENVSARFDIESHAGGRIDNRLTDDKMQKAKYGPRRWLEFSSGGGGAEVRVSTVSGRVILDKN